MIRAMLAGCLFALAAAAQGGELRGRVVAVMDGDTLAVLDAGRQEHRIRLAEIDAPEKGQPFGQRSKQSLSGLCFGREAVIEDRGHDRYGRAIGRVSCGGIDTSAELTRTKKSPHCGGPWCRCPRLFGGTLPGTQSVCAAGGHA